MYWNIYLNAMVLKMLKNVLYALKYGAVQIPLFYFTAS